MIKRVVKMTFQPEQVPAFLAVFEESKFQIRQFPGCQHLELWRDEAQPAILFTYSWWTSPAHLEAYRQSELFQRTWAKTKVLFAGKPEAWSIQALEEVNL